MATRRTLDNNIATQLVFRMDADAKNVADRFKPLKAEDIQNLPPYTVAARVMGTKYRCGACYGH
jgi:hypothetical protein